MSFTYLQLKDAVKAYTEYEETSFVNNIPLFIRLSEERILKNVQLSLFRKNATAQTSASVQYIKVPSDFLAPFSLSMTGTDGDKFFVDFKDPSFVQSYTPDPTTTGLPKYYCVFDVDNFLMAPTPNAAYSLSCKVRVGFLNINSLVRLSHFYFNREFTAIFVSY